MLPNHDSIRALFPGASDKTFLDAACVSIAPTVAVEAITKFLNDAMLCPEPSATAQHIAMDAARETVRTEAAKLINASIDEIAIVESTTAGLNAIAGAIPFEDGDNVVMCDLEFLQVAIPIDNLRRFKRIELRPVHHHNGMVTAEDFARACDSRTKAIVVSSVQWSNGLKLDLGALSGVAIKHSAWLIVDAIQQLGASVIDASTLGVDVVACGGHKWLNAPFGCGFLYINQKRLGEIEPVMRGYLTLQDPEGGWGRYFATPEITPFREYGYVSNAKKFETGGTSNYPGAIGLGASLKLINDIGAAAIEEHVRELSRELIEGLKRVDARVVTPDEDKRRAGIVTFRMFDEPERDERLAEFLLSRRIYISTRYTAGIGGTRASVHFFNNREDIGQLLEAVGQFDKA
ncbi:MAG: aminotransferase class V-fold PLP-dependent enzyme [Acidobacteriota bacterium]|nr:aminotransferase class V-fold PLP-dependent enzyme [Acidobacteriota bacterium]